jgi:hypothetical protein
MKAKTTSCGARILRLEWGRLEAGLRLRTRKARARQNEGFVTPAMLIPYFPQVLVLCIPFSLQMFPILCLRNMRCLTSATTERRLPRFPSHPPRHQLEHCPRYTISSPNHHQFHRHRRNIMQPQKYVRWGAVNVQGSLARSVAQNLQ